MAGEFFWLLPFTAMVFLSMVLLRSAPEFPQPDPRQIRIILDVEENETPVPEPFLGVVGGLDFLQKTHASDMLAKIGGPKNRPRYGDGELIFWFYPLLVRDPKMWDFPTDLESVLAHDRGYVYFDLDLKRFGLYAVTCSPRITVPDPDDYISRQTLCLNRLINKPDQGRTFMSGYHLNISNLLGELRLETEVQRPRVVTLVYSHDDWTRLWGGHDLDQRLGFRNAADGLMALGRGSEAERILAMDPDMIILYVGDALRFMQDPRWRGLRAVQEKKVYGSIGRLHHYTFDLDTVPLWFRWLAELAYPDRLEPKLRTLIREHYENNYGYRFKDEELDWLLRLDENRFSVNYDRFDRNLYYIK
ncbi:MAG: hypothetical protein LBP22_05500 [Deltaproteobacteria bacterium]|nr:hypothetical protein [Deltaproteobacteria bacterium]